MWRRAFLEDPWQKLGALALAIGVWYVAFRNTTKTETLELPVRPAPDLPLPAAPPGEIRVAVPKEFGLDAPAIVRVRLRGTSKDFPLAYPLVGVFDPVRATEKEPFRETTTFRVRAEDLRWSPPHARDLIDGIEPDPIVLRFEKLESRTVRLDARYLDVRGEPAEGYSLVLERVRFSPRTVTLLGRPTELARFAEGEAVRLEPLPLGGEEGGVVRMLGLHPSLVANGLSMEPRSVTVTLPVEPRPTEVRFRARVETVAFGPGAEERRAAFRLRPEDAERDFVLAFRGAPPVSHLDSERAASLVQIFVDLGEIPAEELARGERRFELPLRETLRLSRESVRGLEVRDPSGRRTAIVERLLDLATTRPASAPAAEPTSRPAAEPTSGPASAPASEPATRDGR